MQTQRKFKCRICGNVRAHAIIEDFDVGELVVCGQCLGCGFISIHQLDKEIKGAVIKTYKDGRRV